MSNNTNRWKFFLVFPFFNHSSAVEFYLFVFWQNELCRYYELRSPISLNNNISGLWSMKVYSYPIRIHMCVVCIHMNIWIIIFIYGRAHVPGLENDWPQILSMNWKLEIFFISFQPMKFAWICFFFKFIIYSNFSMLCLLKQMTMLVFQYQTFFFVGFRVHEIRVTDGNEFSFFFSILNPIKIFRMK